MYSAVTPQVFSNNMAQKGEPRVTACKASDNWTSITFTPDYAKFGMEGLDVDMVALMRKRTYDLCGVVAKGMKVRICWQYCTCYCPSFTCALCNRTSLCACCILYADLIDASAAAAAILLLCRCYTVLAAAMAGRSKEFKPPEYSI